QDAALAQVPLHAASQVDRALLKRSAGLRRLAGAHDGTQIARREFAEALGFFVLRFLQPLGEERIEVGLDLGLGLGGCLDRGGLRDWCRLGSLHLLTRSRGLGLGNGLALRTRLARSGAIALAGA